LLLVQRLELLVDLSAVVEPVAHRSVQGTGDVQQRSLAAMVNGEIKRMVQLAFLAAASRFAAGARVRRQLSFPFVLPQLKMLPNFACHATARPRPLTGCGAARCGSTSGEPTASDS